VNSVAAENTADKLAPNTIVLIHGLWMTPLSWEHWIERYEARGFRVFAPAWPGMDGDIDLGLDNENNFKCGFGNGSKKLAAKRRQKVYRRVRMQVKVGEELEISLGIREPPVGKLGTASVNSSGSTSPA
jgi:hypothetical protein